MKKHCILIIIVIISQQLLAQNSDIKYPDTLIIETGNIVQMTLPQKHIQKLNTTFNIDTVLLGFYSELDKLRDRLIDTNSQYIITYHEHFDNVTTISYEKKPVKLYMKSLTGNQKDKWFSVNYICHIYSNSYSFVLKSNSIDEILKLKEIAIQKKIESYKNRLKKQKEGGNQCMTFITKLQSDSLKTELQFSNYKAMDQLILSIGTGVNIIKHNIVPDLSFGTGLSFSKKGILRTRYTSSINMNYHFPADNEQNDFKSNINTFLSLGYYYNFSKDPGDEKWLGCNLGYLLNKGKTFYPKNTFRFEMQWQTNRNLIFSSLLYFDKDFHNLIPSVRIGFGF